MPAPRPRQRTVLITFHLGIQEVMDIRVHLEVLAAPDPRQQLIIGLILQLELTVCLSLTPVYQLSSVGFDISKNSNGKYSNARCLLWSLGTSCYMGLLTPRRYRLKRWVNAMLSAIWISLKRLKSSRDDWHACSNNKSPPESFPRVCGLSKA